MDGQQHMGIRPPGKAFSLRVCPFLPSSSSCLSLLSSAHFRAFALLFLALFAPRLCVSHTVSAMLLVYSTSTLHVFSHTQALSGSYTVAVWWFKCKPGSMCTLKHSDTHTHAYIFLTPTINTSTKKYPKPDTSSSLCAIELHCCLRTINS